MSRHDWWGAALVDAGADHAPWAQSERIVDRGELRRRVDTLVAWYRGQGIDTGSTVALNVPPSWAVLASLLALWRCGAQVALIDVRLRDVEVDRLLSMCEPQHLVTSRSQRSAAPRFRDEQELAVSRRPGGRPATDDCCLVQFSSGSTGEPKIVGRTPDSLLEEIDRYAHVDGMPVPGDRVLLLASMTHTWGLIGGFLAGLHRQTTLVVPGTMLPNDMVAAATAAGAAAIIGVPAHFDLLGRASRPGRWPELRVAVSAGERMDPRTLARFEQGYGMRLGQVYGMTEVGIIAGDLAGEHRPPVVGRPAPGIHVEVVDGFVHVRLPRSPYLFGTGEGRYAGGRLNTGDLGRWESDGVLAVTGRSDSRVTIGGLKVDLTAVEAALCEHQLVREAVVVYDEGVLAYVGAPPELTTDQLMVWCRSRLAAYEIPRRFVISEQVPRNATGKLLRSAERLRAAAGATPA